MVLTTVVEVLTHAGPGGNIVGSPEWVRFILWEP